MLSSQGATHVGTFHNRKSDYKLYIFTPGPPSIADCEQSAEDFCKKNVSSLMQNPKTRLMRATKDSPLQVFTTVLRILRRVTANISEPNSKKRGVERTTILRKQNEVSNNVA